MSAQFNYDKDGQTYGSYRKTDQRIAAYVEKAIGEAQTVLNVGAGTGSYEPKDKYVISVEPSKTMRLQRAQKNKAPAVIGTAENLPFDDDSFDASMAMITIHHWGDMEKGLQELLRVSKGRVIVMTFDPDALDIFWNVNYFPEVVQAEKERYPSVKFIMDVLGGNCEIITIPIPIDCADGFQEAFYGRPEAFLDKEIRNNQSAWGFVSEEEELHGVQLLKEELESGEWDRKYGKYRTQPFFEGALRLIVAEAKEGK
ncbi:class I SAM-dependent methyltransferase [Virgibacillus sp. YIM 98842]|uniref:class I SAM-dependent methyltransferase n=1 Tax=Virgibacillus sp. YIM 98842 TaxID=2663533 RepID=UPI0013DA136B|nr:class I SAM-dependent methyltransferase [Virgibacillus sp. YIM 98842]